ncbi:helix-turn-helix domain-containing protein [Microvirga antarctica]|uniref:helix-turn-helix domain-containing protein n=1 Tax=Microvirga antarctica TaxID=2819233 RepID=UPI001B30AE86|nr:helix-turn-helix transcriptional regulator [Microvirga antarctica]
MKKSPNAADGHIGRRMRLLRQQLGISQERMGEALGITFQQIQKYEKGTNRISAGRLVAVATIFGVPIESFFEGMEPDTKAIKTEPDPLRFLDTALGRRLGRAFGEIGDEQARLKLVELAEALKGMSKVPAS